MITEECVSVCCVKYNVMYQVQSCKLFVYFVSFTGHVRSCRCFSKFMAQILATFSTVTHSSSHIILLFIPYCDMVLFPLGTRDRCVLVVYIIIENSCVLLMF